MEAPAWRLSISLSIMSDRITYTFLLSCLFCLSLPFLSGCTRQAGAGSGGAGVPPPPEVIVDNVSQEDVQIHIYAEGRTVPFKSVEIRTRVSGYLEELFFKPGAIVKEGDRLALIEQATYQIALDSAKAELASAKAQSVLADANLDRAKRLLESRSITTAEFQAEEANYDMSLAAVDRAEAAVRNAELSLQYTDMRSPITGKTTKNLVDIGNYVSPTGAHAVLLAVTQLDPMYVEFHLSDRQYADLKNRIGFRDAFHRAMDASEEGEQTESDLERTLALTGMPVDVSFMTGADVLNYNFDVPGQVETLVDNQINFHTARVTLRAAIRNPLLKTDDVEDYKIYAGQACRVRVPYEKVENAILIREEAILTDLDTKYVLVVEKRVYQPKDPYGVPLKDENGEEIQPYETDVVVRKDITLGRLLDSQRRIVLAGLEPGESYIVLGVQRVRIGVEAKPTTLEDYNADRAAGKR